MASRNSLRRRIRNHFREHATVYQILGILGGTVILGGGFILLVKILQGSREPAYEAFTFTEEEEAGPLALAADPAEQSFPQPVGDETMPLRRILEFVLAAHGGRDQLNRVTTLRRQGEVRLFEDGVVGRTMRTSILFRAPDQLRYHYVLDDLEITAASDRDGVWQRLRRGNRVGPVEDLEGIEALLMRLDLATIRPLSDTLSDPTRLEPVAPPTGFGRPVYAIRHRLDWMDEVLVFDRFNCLLLQRDVRLPLPDGSTLEVKIEYGDYRYVEQLAFPFFTRVSVDGTVMNEMVLESVEINVGALPLVFERPTD
jgi:hypothetical protein